MRIRTLGQLDYFLDFQVSWRKKELTTLKFAVEAARPADQGVITRAGAGLLYAHWEGFIKDAGTAYVQFVSRQGLSYEHLASPFLALAARRRILEAGKTQRWSLHSKLVHFFLHGLGQEAVINWRGSVRTQSNLDFRVLREILLSLGLDERPYVLKARPVIDRLVRVRNGIAHGVGLRIDSADYTFLHSEIVVLIGVFREQISEAAVRQQYHC
jgi:hypothetical protein